MTKIVITAAGKGTRLLPFTKEMPKEMMPIFSQMFSSKKVVIPLLQYVYEQLYSMNFRDYCFVVGREKRSIEDHFTPHESYLRDLDGEYKTIMKKFYQKLEKSHLVWINQNKPLGFGDAVRRSEKYVGSEDFIVHAGDVTILSNLKHPIMRLIDIAKKNPDAKAILLCKKVKDSKRYGVPTVEKISNGLFSVKEVIEKPEKPKSEFGILPLYYFRAEIFSNLKKIKPGKGKEFQLTDAIQKMIQQKQKVLAIILNKNEEEVDVGTVKSYRDAQDITFRKA
ncbi:sugar phosphate nucleotidyltransferase [Nitrosopumilus sp.]|uniref:sugar phosphate nucleotidyltransferase n=1 Tax=Nitrosopumilus sp. TaxID=2024843 RepID=UPI003D099570